MLFAEDKIRKSLQREKFCNHLDNLWRIFTGWQFYRCIFSNMYIVLSIAAVSISIPSASSIAIAVDGVPIREEMTGEHFVPTMAN